MQNIFKQVREKFKFTQRELADYMFEQGFKTVREKHVNRWENGHNLPNRGVRLFLAKELKLPEQEVKNQLIMNLQGMVKYDFETKTFYKIKS